MKFKPPVDKPALMDCIRQAYNLPITSLQFLPQGMVGCHYIAECSGREPIFITLLNDSLMASLQRQRLAFTLALMDALYERGLFTAQPALYRTTAGALSSEFQGQALVIREYIAGGNLGEAWPLPAEEMAHLGRLLAGLHSATAGLEMEVPFREQFDLPFEAVLLAGLVELEHLPQEARPGKLELREMILSRKGQLLGLLARLHELGASAAALNPPQVLVHTDMTPNNILRTPQGGLFIVDWEGVMLAPAEFDLFIFAGEGFTALLRAYLRAAGYPELHPELFAYYLYRRNLEDIAFSMNTILQENTTADEDNFELEIIHSDCISSWPFLKNSLAWAGEQIREAMNG
jgi:Ser/Thr protein kinase RdoA (MazF antagonist)